MKRDLDILESLKSEEDPLSVYRMCRHERLRQKDNLPDIINSFCLDKENFKPDIETPLWVNVTMSLIVIFIVFAVICIAIVIKTNK